jgi:hypothetical protein
VRRPTVALVSLACVLALGGCDQAADLTDQARAAVDGARTQLDELASRADTVRDRFTWCGAAVRLGTAVVQRDTEAAEAAADDLRVTAPRELEDELRTIVEAVGRSQMGDPTALLDGDTQDSARTLLDTAIRDCGTGEG